MKTEKERRIYYQNIVYAVCSAIERVDGSHPGAAFICGTADEPSTAVQQRIERIAKEVIELRNAGREPVSEHHISTVQNERWAKKREEEAATMCAKRTPTNEETDRAMVIGKWFCGWTDETGPCPINVASGHWGKKLCALCEWIAVLETEASKPNDQWYVGKAFFADNYEAAEGK